MLCECVAITESGEQKFLTRYCGSFAELYGELRKDGLRIVQYEVNYKENQAGNRLNVAGR